MNSYFTGNGRSALRQCVKSKCLIAFDFDGTLAPIVTTPEAAMAPISVSRRLAVLAAVRPVAVITGRAVADVRERIGFEPHYIVGNHGAEGLPGAVGEVGPAHIEDLRRCLARHGDLLGDVGVKVEDKGYSLSLHYRTAPDRERAQFVIDAVLAESLGEFSVFGGKFVVNVAPAEAPGKDHALKALIAHSGVECAVFIGDDVTDETIFDAAPPSWLTIRIGRDNPESRAKYYLDGQFQMPFVIQDMLDALNADNDCR
ncbi:MAG: trehalose-phosphatase [Gammaproteobacteria bacterium]|nr:trehalose-phosphatase [Gammaproteobacteria bacterium]